MKYRVLLLTLLFTTSLFAQTNSVAYELMKEAVDKGNYTQALSYAEKMVNSDRAKYGVKHIEYAGSLVNLGLVYSYIGDYTQAESTYLKALDICKSTGRKDHPTYIACLKDLGDLYSDMGEYSRAETYLVEALKIYRSKYGNKHEKTAKCLNNMGSLYRMMGDYAKAESYCLEATQTIKSIFGSKSSEYAVCLQTLGDLYVAMGNYTKAEKHYLDMLAIRKSLVGKYSPLYAGSLTALANAYVNSGNYAQAEEYFLEALSIYKTTVDKYNLDYAVCMNNLAGLYGHIGDYHQAEHYFLQVLEIRNHTLGEEHLDCNSPLHNLGSIYHYMRKYSQAEQYYTKALKILESHLGKEHPEYVLTLHNVANLYRDMGKYNQAELYYLYVQKVIKELVGEEHPFYATCLHNIAQLYRITKQHYKSESNYLRALQLREMLLGETHPHYTLSIYEMGQLYSDMGNYAKAIEYLTKARKQYKELYLSSLNFMTEQQRKSYWTTLQEHYDVTYPQFVYQYHTSQPSVSIFAYDNELFRKGILLSSSEAIRRSILSSGNSTLIQQWEQLTSIQQNIIYLEENDPDASSLPVFKHRADSLEKIITRTSVAYRNHQAMWNINWESVRQHLAPNEVAIEFFSTPIGENNTTYCALLLRHNSPYPTLIPLFEEKDIVPLLTNTNDIYNYSVNGKKISQAIWGKVLPKLKAGETIYFSAAGILHQIAIEYLPYDAQRTMSDINTIVRLSSTREIAINQSPNKNTTATIYGGIQYSMYAEELLLESEPYQRTIAGTSRSTNNINRGIVQYLPGTKIEANAINTLMKKNNIITKLYTESKANEESFKALSGKLNNILHIGTHGFMWNDNIHRHTDPLARCGLLFAGSNIALSGRVKELEKGVQDGILTAKEISLLDLRGTDLVVLSACETAKGDITSEGVFGLQRAFKMAGAQTIIMSLWKVDDYATQLLMTEFYTNWISNKYASKHAAFTQAQKTVKTKYPSPEYWAGFILLD